MLANCLESIKEIDEIVIVDTGSTDKTRDVALKYTDKFFENEYVWNDNFSEARNFVNSKATGDWLLTIDADEVLEDGAISKIREKIKTTPCDALCLQIVGQNTSFYSPRVYRNQSHIIWKGAIHNYLEGIVKQERMDVKIKFYSSPTHADDPNRALRILTKEVKANPKLIREVYYLGREYTYKQEWEKAVYWLQIYLEKKSWAGERADGYYLLAKSYWQLQQGEKARDACLQAIKINANFKAALKLMVLMSGPKNSKKWAEYAELATNDDVLFTHEPIEQKAEHEPIEQKAEYYNQILKSNHNMSRYEDITKKVAEWASGNVLEIGCGTAELQYYVNNYYGFDFSDEAVKIANNPHVWKADAYKEDFGNYDTYVLTEVLEHLDDIKIISKIPANKNIIFSVPSFTDPAHVRTYSKKTIEERFNKYIKIENMIRFNWINKKWTEGEKDTSFYIILCRGTTIYST